MKLSVVIVNYNVKYYVEQALTSLLRATAHIPTEVFVVDNHSHDGSVAYLAQRFPQVHVISSNHNLGFARANNLAIRQAYGEYILLLNPDTIVAEHTIAETLAFMDATADAGALGVRMLTTTGEAAPESRRGLPSPATAFYKMSGLCSLFPSHKRFGHYYMSGLPWDKPAPIDVVSGAFCLLRSEALQKAGLLDEDFFMYGEDIDLSYRILKAGYHNYYHPAPILHYKGESTQKSSFKYVHVFYEAMLIFLRKHYARTSSLLVFPIRAAIYAKAFTALLAMLYGKCRKSLGFVVSAQQPAPHYLFLGSRETLEECRAIATAKAIEADYIEADGHTNQQGHLSAEIWSRLEQHPITYIVYDVCAYSYEQILSLFAQRPSDKARMAFYDRQTHNIITEKEILSL